ncbi:Frataxin [Hyaloscypha variabilis F]|uniref:ferroxidase n=1 Tax=Hyaloscypha variabilis (strain UAMH 11265 / GT02V1 / F) TaxID=1149755 RepID=A0A2J6S4V8_HYAVF|nr:Frataxin [Hyaloscypha variabilis F]
MTRGALSKLVRSSRTGITPLASRSSSAAIRTSILRPAILPISIHGSRASSIQTPRFFSTTRPSLKGLSPESENPQPTPREREHNVSESASEPANITIEQFHELADTYLNALIEKLEELQEETEEVDVEYSAGVLTLSFPPNGTYVINKQPPNKQIWLSSPTTGPKRYDYVVLSEGQDSKEGTGKADWIYLRDGSTLTELLHTEVGVDMEQPYAPVPHQGD